MQSKLLLVIFLSSSTASCVPQKCILLIQADDHTTAEDGLEHHEHREAEAHRAQHRRHTVQSFVQRLIARATPEACVQSDRFKLIQIGIELVCHPVDTLYNTARTWWDILTCLGPT